MRTSALLTLTLVSLLPSAEAAELTFSSPAQAAGQIEATSTSWVAILFAEADAASGKLAWPAGTIQEHTWTEYTVRAPEAEKSFQDEASGDSSTLSPGAAELTTSAGIAGIFARGRDVKVRLESNEVSLLGQPSESCLGRFLVESEREPNHSRDRCMAGDAVAVRTNAGGPFSINLSGLHEIEWHNLDVRCNANSCPPRGERSQEETSMGGTTVQNRTHRFTQLLFESQEGSLELSGTGSTILFGGAAPSFVIDGWVRLPLANSQNCDSCAGPQANTVEAEGIIHLDQVRVGPDGALLATMSGDLASARFDEQPVDPAVLSGMAWGAVAATTVGLGLLLKLLVAPLFTRLSKAQALEHPRRKLIFEYVQQHPGANFREVARKTNIAAGTVRHHLTILERSGHLVERPHLGTVRLFENHGKFDHNWSDVVLLREPTLAVIHDWLRDHPQSPQKAILEAMEHIGWSRSTTQHRLARLVDGGLATIRLQGRLKIYTAAQSPPPKAVVGLPSAVPSPA